ncbi:hypothetical protein B0J11DRAFT_12841 [Dendryphion nanum]|uniref:RING-type E3 ubiquitin transferase n=1 Tax=Dendryphion nanum TaxID=256645 RepID=A0A9P9EIK6_9PLEO|nr:hypothetical protein B0J11DRAFT_12841 [Dendryphion nanum]
MDSTAVSSKDGPTDDCVICLSTITERAITVPCNHCLFDFLCLVSWLQENSTCPLCKTEVTAVQYDWRSETDFKSYTVRAAKPIYNPSNNGPPLSNPPPPSRSNLLPRRTRRPQALRRAYSPPSSDVALLRRRFVYKEKLFSLYVGANRLSAYRNLTPQMIAESPDIQSRARMFIRRELRVFRFLYNEPENTPSTSTTTSSNAEWLLSYMISILKNVDIKASDGHAEDLLTDFLGRDNARLFLHELNVWLRSPYTKLEDWDRHVQYHINLPDEFDQDDKPVWHGKRTRSRSRSPNGEGRSSWREREAINRYRPD